jgi:hypothetical protein
MPKNLITFQLGEAVEHRGVVVAPLFPTRDPACSYLTLDEALPRGLEITETDAAGTVPELAVDNPLDQKVLLYDGEELVGAKQNRILNVTVLVAEQTAVRIPVSSSSRAAGRLARSRWTQPATSLMRNCAAARPRRSPRDRSPAGSRRARCGTRCAQRPSVWTHRRRPELRTTPTSRTAQASTRSRRTSRSSRARAAHCSPSETTAEHSARLAGLRSQAAGGERRRRASAGSALACGCRSRSVHRAGGVT